MNASLVFGYHGTSLAAAQSIQANGFELSRQPYDWLGDGVYFFQDAPNRAWNWAIQRFPESPAVVVSQIRLENCVDLLDVDWVDALNIIHNNLRQRFLQEGRKLPKQKAGAHNLDREVFNLLVQVAARQGTLLKVIRGVFQEGVPVYPESALFNLSHVQIAVRDTLLIEKTWIIQSKEGTWQ